MLFFRKQHAKNIESRILKVERFNDTFYQNTHFYDSSIMLNGF